MKYKKAYSFLIFKNRHIDLLHHFLQKYVWKDGLTEHYILTKAHMFEKKNETKYL